MKIEQNLFGGLMIRDTNGRFLSAPQALMKVATKKERVDLGTLVLLIGTSCVAIAGLFNNRYRSIF